MFQPLFSRWNWADRL